MKPTELLHPEQMLSIFAGYRLYAPLYEFRRLWKIVEVKNIMGSGLAISLFIFPLNFFNHSAQGFTFAAADERRD